MKRILVFGGLFLSSIGFGQTQLPVLNIGNSTGDNPLQIGVGNGAAGNRFAYIDLVGDDTYTDYGLRLIRYNSGFNASSQLVHRGLGLLQFITYEPADMIFSTSNVERMRVTSNGNVGIGTNSPNSSYKLDVQGSARFNSISALNGSSQLAALNVGNSGGDNNFQIGVGNGAVGNRYAYIDFVGDDTYTDFGLRLLRNNTGPNASSQLFHMGLGELQLVTVETADMVFKTSNAERIRVKANGNVGIGTIDPTRKLNVVDNSGIGISDAAQNGVFDLRNDGTTSSIMSYSGINTSNIAFFTNVVGQGVSEKMRITGEGNIGIGTAGTPLPTGYKLAINGNVIANKVVVKQYPWADFVFKPDYKLPPLSMVEQHIKEKGHLPNIPSEKEVAENGIDLGSMDAKLLQKVEELTLYIIKQEKRADNQQKQIEELKKQNALLMQLIKQK